MVLFIVVLIQLSIKFNFLPFHFFSFLNWRYSLNFVLALKKGIELATSLAVDSPKLLSSVENVCNLWLRSIELDDNVVKELISWIILFSWPLRHPFLLFLKKFNGVRVLKPVRLLRVSDIPILAKTFLDLHDAAVIALVSRCWVGDRHRLGLVCFLDLFLFSCVIGIQTLRDLLGFLDVDNVRFLRIFDFSL